MANTHLGFSVDDIWTLDYPTLSAFINRASSPGWTQLATDVMAYQIARANDASEAEIADLLHIAAAGSFLLRNR